jgi:hypothetical protein
LPMSVPLPNQNSWISAHKTSPLCRSTTVLKPPKEQWNLQTSFKLIPTMPTKPVHNRRSNSFICRASVYESFWSRKAPNNIRLFASIVMNKWEYIKEHKTKKTQKLSPNDPVMIKHLTTIN